MAEDEDGRKGLRRLAGSTWSAAGTGVAVVASCVALTFTLWPGLIPDPRTALAATLTVEAMDQGVARGTFLKQYDPGTFERLTPDVRRFLSDKNRDPLGDVVFLRVKVQGQKHGSVTLKKVTYSWKRPRHVIENGTPEGWKPDTPNDEWIAPVWINDPGTGDFFVRLMLVDNGVILAFADTKRIPAQ